MPEIVAEMPQQWVYFLHSIPIGKLSWIWYCVRNTFKDPSCVLIIHREEFLIVCLLWAVEDVSYVFMILSLMRMMKRSELEESIIYKLLSNSCRIAELFNIWIMANFRYFRFRHWGVECLTIPVDIEIWYGAKKAGADLTPPAFLSLIDLGLQIMYHRNVVNESIPFGYFWTLSFIIYCLVAA